MSEVFEEEPWEAEISNILGQLPEVEPPPGFLAGAVDHRPLFAARTMLGLGLAAAAVFVAASALGGLDRPHVVPELDALAARHSSAAAGVADPDYEVVDNAGGPPISLPGNFEPEAVFEADELSQSVYATGDNDPVSVFSQPGRVDWEKLPAEGLEVLEGNRAWVDPDAGVLVFEADDSTVTVVGLSSGELSDLLSGLPGAGGGLVAGLRDAAAVLSAELGFPSLS